LDLGLDGKTALILGATGGLGSATAALLAGEGARVALAGRRATALDQIASEIHDLGGDCITIEWELSNLSSIPVKCDMIRDALGEVDILLNVTGGPPAGSILDQDALTWREHFDLMVLPVIKITDYVVASMRKRGWGRIITSTSSGVVAPIPHLGLSNSLRAALIGWNKTLAGEVAPYGITCNVVVPGRIDTARVQSLDEAAAARGGESVEEVRAKSRASIPAGRYGKPAEFAFAVAMLASEGASYITGSTLRVDGGLIRNV
jgi:3-oxoacyl-[acyl-carrier protein] reductase